MRRHLSPLSGFLVVTTVLAPIGLAAQVTRPSASLVLTEGAVFVNDQPIAADSAASVLPDAAVVRTAEGRAAIALKRGGWLFLDLGASVRVFGNGMYNFNQLEALTGSAIVASGTSAPLVECGSEIRLSDSGVFRFDTQPANASRDRSCQIRVYQGAAAVPLTSLTNALRAGQMMVCGRRCGDMRPIQEFSPAQLDTFDQWARQVQARLSR